MWISIQIGQIRLGLNTSKVKDWDGSDGPLAFRQWKRAANINRDGQVTKFTDSTNFSHVNTYGGLMCHKLLSNYCPHEITCILSPSDSHMADEMRVSEKEKNKLTLHFAKSFAKFELLPFKLPGPLLTCYCNTCNTFCTSLNHQDTAYILPTVMAGGRNAHFSRWFRSCTCALTWKCIVSYILQNTHYSRSEKKNLLT